ncbi:MAG: hypothetical protein SF029_16710 [bacterium]|nr:hypothetical protein [bacterium]
MSPSTVSSVTFAVWNAHWQVIQEVHLNPLAYETGSATGIFDLLHDAVEAFHTFADHHFHFFARGFLSTSPTLTLSPQLPPDVVLDHLLGRISQEVHRLQQIAVQRMNGFLPGVALRELARADALAALALQPALECGWLHPRTQIVTYFDRLIPGYRMPYGHLAFLSLPSSAVKVPRDLLAVLHEAGHHVYANGTLPVEEAAQSIAIRGWVEKTLHQDFAQHPWLMRWAAEIFADVYGCLIGGEALALNTQLQAQVCAVGSSTAITPHLLADAPHRPVPFFRPEIALAVLRRLGTPGAAVLAGRWGEWQEDALAAFDEAPALYHTMLRAVFGDVEGDSFDSAAAHIRAVLSGFVEALLDALIGEDTGGWPTLDLPGFDSSRSEADNWKHTNAALKALPQAERDVTYPAINIEWEAWRKRICARVYAEASIIPPTDGTRWTVEQWMPIYLADGWTAEARPRL